MRKTIIWIIALFLFLAFFAFASCEAKKAPAAADPVSETPTTSEETVSEEIYVYLNGNRLALSLAELLKDKDLSYEADDFGGFEKVGDLGHSLPRNDEFIHTKSGDVILYQGRNLCLYYGANSYTFTRIGRIDGYSESELRSLLGAGNGKTLVRLSLR